MLLRQLEYLSALAREGHFGRAAEACHVSQPALSAGIRRLEGELGVQIVQRAQRFEGFTAEGAQVLTWAQRMVAEHDAMRAGLTSMREGLSGVLRIGAIPTALPVVSRLTAPLREQHPMVRFSLDSMASRDIVTGLNNFDIDVGLTYVDGDPLGKVRVITLYPERYLFLTPRDGKFAGRDTIGWADAASAPLCLLTPSMQNRRILDGCFAAAGVEARPVLETDTVSAIYSHIASMGLSSIVPHAWLPDAPETAAVIALPRPERSFHVGLVLAGGGPEPLLARSLVDLASEVDIAAELDQDADRRLAPARRRRSR